MYSTTIPLTDPHGRGKDILHTVHMRLIFNRLFDYGKICSSVHRTDHVTLIENKRSQNTANPAVLSLKIIKKYTMREINVNILTVVNVCIFLNILKSTKDNYIFCTDEGRDVVSVSRPPRDVLTSRLGESAQHLGLVSVSDLCVAGVLLFYCIVRLIS